MNFKEAYSQKIELIDNYITFHLDSKYSEVSPELAEAMKYSVLNGGKRLRSILCIEICHMLGGSAEKALPFAAAIEMIHAYSLVHDDLPAMDNSDVRRGMPSCHKKFGEAMGILCGDALLNAAYELISESCEDSSSVQAFKCIAAAAGAKGMIDGQVIDLNVAATNECYLKLLTKLIELKTMALIRAAILTGACIANCDEKIMSDMSEFAYHLGLAFQLRDDFEDIIEDGAQCGDSPNFVNFLGAANAKEMLENHAASAANILKRYDNSEFLSQLHSFLFD
ncbi:MAG: polyprenyl synthetase family protein [Clostridia bacterium]|nr:polyprenyl synthetase family protein [Clostridia bacterium]